METARKKDNQLLASEAKTIQAQLEGLFRQLYSSATQQSLVQLFPDTKRMYEKVGELIASLEILIDEYETRREVQVAEAEKEEETAPTH